MFKFIYILILTTLALFSIQVNSYGGTPSIPCYYLDGSWKTNVVITTCTREGGYYLKKDRDLAMEKKNVTTH